MNGSILQRPVALCHRESTAGQRLFAGGLAIKREKHQAPLTCQAGSQSSSTRPSHAKAKLTKYAKENTSNRHAKNCSAHRADFIALLFSDGAVRRSPPHAVTLRDRDCLYKRAGQGYWLPQSITNLPSLRNRLLYSFLVCLRRGQRTLQGSDWVPCFSLWPRSFFLSWCCLAVLFFAFWPAFLSRDAVAPASRIPHSLLHRSVRLRSCGARYMHDACLSSCSFSFESRLVTRREMRVHQCGWSDTCRCLFTRIRLLYARLRHSLCPVCVLYVLENSRCSVLSVLSCYCCARVSRVVEILYAPTDWAPFVLSRNKTKRKTLRGWKRRSFLRSSLSLLLSLDKILADRCQKWRKRREATTV